MKNDNGYCSGVKKGVMVPPLTTDVNNDGVDDIVMSAYDGLIVLFDGKTMQKVWTAKFDNCESYRYIYAIFT